ncbi:hypothetical protein B0H11DRAFT_1711944, partial [Mycena galericulata]
TAAYVPFEPPDYPILAARITFSMQHQEATSIFSHVMTELYYRVNTKTRRTASLIAKITYEVVFSKLQSSTTATSANPTSDLKTLEHPYLVRLDGRVERPLHLVVH